MAICPECGGRLTPLRPLFTSPWRNIGCRWCRATLAPSYAARWGRDMTLLAALLGFSAWIWFRFRNDPVLFVGVALVLGWLALLVLGWLAESLFPLRTIVPRDSRRFRRSDTSPGQDSDV